MMRTWSNKKLVGTAKWHSHSGDSLSVSYKSERILTVRSSNHPSEYLPQRDEILSP